MWRSACSWPISTWGLISVTALCWRKLRVRPGWTQSEVSAKLESDTDIDAVNAEVERAYRMGVTGVPCFIFAQKQGLMGAQPAEVLADAIGKLAA